MQSLEETLKVLDRATELPLVENFICNLQNCRKKKNLVCAKRVHALICNNGLEVHTDVGNYIVPMLVECGSIFDAQEVFNKLLHRNQHSWTSIIVGYIHCGKTQHALNLYPKMQKDGIYPSRYTLMALLKACARLKDVEEGRAIHAEIAQKGFERDLFIANTLVDMYAKCSTIAEAREVFLKMPVRDVVSWNALIAGFAEHGPSREALTCFDQMRWGGICPDIITFVSTLKACGSIGAIGKGQEIHVEIAQKGLEREILICNTLILMYAKCGLLADAYGVFDRLPSRDVVSWNALIAGYGECGPVQEALKCYEQMHLEGISADAVTFVCILKACGSIGAIYKGREIHAEIAQKGCERYLFVANSLIDMHAKCGSVSEAQEVFDKLSVHDVVTWNALIAGYAEHGPGEEALKCFEQMQLEGIPPVAVTFAAVSKACGSIGAISKGQDMHMDITRKGLERDLFVGNNLIDMYVKCDLLTEALDVFNKLPQRDLVSWNIVLAGYTEHGLGQEVLKYFEQMQLEGVSPIAVTFVCVLKACGSVGEIGKGQEVHAEIVEKGLERDLFVGTSLIDMYAKCGSLLETQNVFNKLVVRNVVLWNALIAGYAEHGFYQEVMKCFEEMQREGSSPDAVTFACSLKACGNIGALGKGREIHSEVAQHGFEKDPSVKIMLVNMYVKGGSLLEAQEVFDKLPGQNVGSWRVLIVGYVEHGLGEEALDCFEQMQLDGMSPDDLTFVCILKACGSIRALDKGREIHMDIAHKGFERDLFVSSTLVDMYAKCGSLLEAMEVFNKLPFPDVVSWNALIAGYVEHGPGQEALKCFDQMQVEGICPDAVTFACILKACGSIGAIAKGREVHMGITEKGFERDPFVCSTLVDMYIKCGSILEAREVFDKLPVRDVVSWNTLISGYAEHGPVQEAIECFKQMHLEGISPVPATFVCALKACGSIGVTSKGEEIHAEIAQKGFERDLIVGNTLINMYARCGSLALAEEVFDKLPVQDIVSWNTLIAGYAEHGPGQEALECFQRMELEGVCPDAATFACVLKACTSIGAIGRGRETHVEIAETGFEIDISVGNALVDMYAKCGLLIEAWEVFDKLPVRDVVTWNAMIKGYGINHEGNMAIQSFEEMQEQGVKPDATTFTCLLSACSHTNLVYKGLQYLKAMREQYCIAPTIEHFSCMVDLLARSGNLYEAEKFLESMGCPPSEGTWTALLSACKTYGEEELGLKCFEKLLHSNLESAASYVLMSNIYSNAGRWHNAYSIEELRKHARAKKKAASALIEVDKNLHEFVVGDNQSKEVSLMLEILSARLKEEGHVPNVGLILKSQPREK